MLSHDPHEQEELELPKATIAEQLRRVGAGLVELDALRGGKGSTPSEQARPVQELLDDVLAAAAQVAAPALDATMKRAAGTEVEGEVALAMAKVGCKLGLPLAEPYAAVPASLRKTEDALFDLARLDLAALPTLSEAELQDRKKNDVARRNLGITRDLSGQGMLEFLDELHQELVKLHEPLVQTFQKALNALEGKACPTFDENHNLVNPINTEADAFGIAFYCEDKAGKVGEPGRAGPSAVAVPSATQTTPWPACSKPAQQTKTKPSLPAR